VISGCLRFADCRQKSVAPEGPVSAAVKVWVAPLLSNSGTQSIHKGLNNNFLAYGWAARVPVCAMPELEKRARQAHVSGTCGQTEPQRLAYRHTSEDGILVDRAGGQGPRPAGSDSSA
jgi:hypothetical protein